VFSIQKLHKIYSMLILLSLISIPLAAQTSSPESEAPQQNVIEEENVVTYPASFFSRYQPNSALDMLEQLPGFVLEKSGELRGYGSDTGNVLIDGRRPSSKRVTVPSILDRIPASQVESIELIRGPIRDIELLGEPEVANVVMRTDVPAAVRWVGTILKNTDIDRLPWFSNVSLSDRWAGIDFNAGLDMFRVASSDRNDENIQDRSGNVTENRLEEGDAREFEVNFDLTASKWVGDTLFTWSSQIGIQDGGKDFLSRRTPVAPGAGTRNEVLVSNTDEFQFEAGFTIERSLTEDLMGNFLFFITREDENSFTTQTDINPLGVQTAELFQDSNQIEREIIFRTEFEWTGLSDHTVRLNLEGAFNLVNNTELQTIDTGAGPVTDFVPGANTRIKESRGDFLLTDIWSYGNFELDYGVGLEVSKLTQTGDANLDRNLFYLKPTSELSYSSNESRRIRLRLARDIAQLVFSDFVSLNLFTDDDLALGNPNLSPETTWVSELGYERRFGRENVLKLTVFHHWISDVQDLIPITLTEEAPGNIGKGRRWGLQLEGTAELDWMGLENGRLDINARLQDSTVVDPLTGDDRILSSTIIRASSQSIFDNDNAFVFVIDYRQDFEESRIAWGWDVTQEAELKLFKVNELDVRNKEPDLNLFVETTRWFGVKMRMELNNILDMNESRNRTIYTGERSLSPLLRRQIQNRTDGREIGISLSGSF
jgi:hypothetical protein